MKNYKINESGLREERYRTGTVNGFNVVKVHSVPQALLIPGYSKGDNLEDALKKAGVTNYSKLEENEQYYGYIAVWNGIWLESFHMLGKMRLSTKDDGQGCLDYITKERLQNGNLLTGEFNVFGGNLHITGDDRHNSFPGLADRLTAAIRSETFEIQLSDEELRHLNQWPCFKNALRLIN